MKVLIRILASIGVGDLLYAVILLTAARFPAVTFRMPFLLWNLRLFSFVGRGEPVGYMPNGMPIYDGGVGFLGIAWTNILLGFVIYPIIVFACISLLKFFKNRNN